MSRRPGPPTVSRPDRAVESLVEQLIGRQRSDGSFAPPPEPPGPSDHGPTDGLVDRATATLALAWAAERGLGGLGAPEAMGRAAAVLIDRLLVVPEGPQPRAVVALDEIGSGSDGAPAIDLAGLGLAALASTERQRPGTISHGDLRTLGDFVVRSHRTGARSAGWASLGLLGLADVDGSQRYRRAAIDVLLTEPGGEGGPTRTTDGPTTAPSQAPVVADDAPTGDIARTLCAHLRPDPLGTPGSTRAPAASGDETEGTGIEITDLPIDVGPFARGLPESLPSLDLDAAPGVTSRRSLSADDHPGLFRLAADIAGLDTCILYRAELVVVGPGPHDEVRPPADRHAMGCRRSLVLLTGNASLLVRSGRSTRRLTTGQVVTVEARTRHHIENPTTTPLVVLAVSTRPRTPGLVGSAFELVASDIDVGPLAAELEQHPELWDLDTRRQRLRPHRETRAIALRDSPVIPGERCWPAGERQRSQYSADGRLLPRHVQWLEDHCRRADLEPGLARLVSLAPGGHVLAHVDRGSYYRLRDRYHLVITGGSSSLTSGAETIHPQPGQLWRFDNQLLHHATNRGTEDRVHLIFDAKPW